MSKNSKALAKRYNEFKEDWEVGVRKATHLTGLEIAASDLPHLPNRDPGLKFIERPAWIENLETKGWDKKNKCWNKEPNGWDDEQIKKYFAELTREFLMIYRKGDLLPYVHKEPDFKDFDEEIERCRQVKKKLEGEKGKYQTGKIAIAASKGKGPTK